MGINNGKAKMNDCGAINKTSTISWGISHDYFNNQ